MLLEDKNAVIHGAGGGRRRLRFFRSSWRSGRKGTLMKSRIAKAPRT